jgi:hypothetical protein
MQPEIPLPNGLEAFFMKRKEDYLLENREKLTLQTVICHPYLLICLLWKCPRQGKVEKFWIFVGTGWDDE